jgi:hypothetical protein
MERIGSYIPNESPIATAPKADVASTNKVRRNSDGGSTSASKSCNRNGKKMTRSASTPQSERRSEGGSSSHVDDGPGSNGKSKTWRSIMANISRSVDELYYLCEDERDESKCREIISFMERAGYDFDKLIERIGEQRKFESSQTSGVSWEVRKPTSTTYLAEVSATFILYSSPSRICSSFRILFPLLIDSTGRVSKRAKRLEYSHYQGEVCIERYLWR